jgi:hypothetical protein
MPKSTDTPVRQEEDLVLLTRLRTRCSEDTVEVDVDFRQLDAGILHHLVSITSDDRSERLADAEHLIRIPRNHESTGTSNAFMLRLTIAVHERVDAETRTVMEADQEDGVSRKRSPEATCADEKSVERGVERWKLICEWSLTTLQQRDDVEGEAIDERLEIVGPVGMLVKDVDGRHAFLRAAAGDKTFRPTQGTHQPESTLLQHTSSDLSTYELRSDEASCSSARLGGR